MTSAVAILLLILAVASVLVIGLAASGDLKRNRIIGIRTAATLSSDDAWRRGHRAGLLPAGIGAGTSAAFAVAGLVTAAAPRTDVLAQVMVACSIVAILAGGAWSTVRATRNTAG